MEENGVAHPARLTVNDAIWKSKPSSFWKEIKVKMKLFRDDDQDTNTAFYLASICLPSGLINISLKFVRIKSLTELRMRLADFSAAIETNSLVGTNESKLQRVTQQ